MPCRDVFATETDQNQTEFEVAGSWVPTATAAARLSSADFDQQSFDCLSAGCKNTVG